MTCITDLIGVKFEYGGRGPDSYDCYGLVMECFRRFHGVELPEMRWCRNFAKNAVYMREEAERSGRWVRLDEPRVGAVCLMNVRGFGAHVGFLHKPHWFLHTLEETGVYQARIYPHRNQMMGYYEYVGTPHSP